MFPLVLISSLMISVSRPLCTYSIPAFHQRLSLSHPCWEGPFRVSCVKCCRQDKNHDSKPPTHKSKISQPSSNVTTEPTRFEWLLTQVEQLLSQGNAYEAFDNLVEAYDLDPNSSRISILFQSCLKMKVELSQVAYYKWKENIMAQLPSLDFSESELSHLFQDRMGLSSLLIDKEQYDESQAQLEKAIEEASFWLQRSLHWTQQANDITLSTNHQPLELQSTTFKHWQPLILRAKYLLYRTNAACCYWEKYFQEGDQLRQSLYSGMSEDGHVPRILHPFDALKFPCVSLPLASIIAKSYAVRSLESVGMTFQPAHKSSVSDSLPRKVFTAMPVNRNDFNSSQLSRKIKIGYISPDFTSRHPLAFLMQHVFRYHNKSQFYVHIYSLTSNCQEEGPEVQAIRESTDSFTYLSLSSMTPVEIYQQIIRDGLDILVDLCGYAGISAVSEIMASRWKLQEMDPSSEYSERRFPIHVSYMGFPASIGSSRVWDYSVFDKNVVPNFLRKYYEEALVYMPHCYFVNSHKTIVGGVDNGILLANDDERGNLRLKYGIPSSAFVYCCHSRPDKIDPSTFLSWMRALTHAREVNEKRGNHDNCPPILWLLRSGKEMEQNIRQFVRKEFGQKMEDVLVFADVAERQEHLRRLGCADVFLDTPAYNAHTLGCDALYIGVPMISLLSNEKNLPMDSKFADISPHINIENLQSEDRLISTEKVASRVGASLLRAVSLEEFIVPDMQSYVNLMMKCYTNRSWFKKACERLCSSRDTSPLFDTQRWVRNFEASFVKMMSLDLASGILPDIIVLDKDESSSDF